VCVLVNDNGSVDARTDDRCLAALCVEEAMIESGLAFTRDLLPVAGLLDVRLTIGAWWDLAVRLVRAGAPHFEAAPAGELERELMLDQVAPLLADALYLHAQTFDLAEELPGITTRQHAVRQQLFRYLSEGLPALVPVLGREQLATQLCRLADAVLLFRYSAVTFNGHRIHYDRAYAQNVEAYPGLVVHGPLLATLLQDFAERSTGRRLQRFSFRSAAPLFDGEPFELCGKRDGDFWIAAGDGRLIQRAHAEFAPSD
jgi:hypothetical protein